MHKLEDLIKRYPQLDCCKDALQNTLDAMIRCREGDGTLFFCGNGGSCADSEHIVGELMKSFMLKRPLSTDEIKAYEDNFGDDGKNLASNLEHGFKAISLTGHPSLNTAVANDTDAEVIFAQQLNCLGRKGDLLMGISTSGNSKNVIHAVRTAKIKGLTTVGLTGEKGGMLKEMCDIAICVPSSCTPVIQELHLPVYHWLCIALEAHFYA